MVDCRQLFPHGQLAITTGASTIAGRRAGYREAIDVLHADRALTHLPVPAPADRATLAAYLDAHAPDAIVCAHDRGAAELMHALLALGRSIPGDIRLAGVDDVEYAAPSVDFQHGSLAAGERTRATVVLPGGPATWSNIKRIVIAVPVTAR